MKKLIAALVMVMAAGCARSAEAQPTTPQTDPEPRAGELDLTTERVVVFKDGYALFVKSGTAVARMDGTVFTEEVPDFAVLGSFWARSDDSPIQSMRAGWQETTEVRSEQTDCITVLELLRANLERKVTLLLAPAGDAEPEELVATITDVLDLAPSDDPKKAQMWSHPYSGMSVHVQRDPVPVEGETVRPLVPSGGQLVVLDTREGRVVLPVAHIQRVTGPKLVTTMSREEEVKTRTKRLTMDVGKAKAGKRVELSMVYFVEGVRWIPTYRVDVGGAKGKAGLSLQGELLNEAEDFEDAAVDLVVGVPNFRFKSVISPLSLERTMRGALAQVAPGLMGNDISNGFSNALFTQRAGELRTGMAAAATGPAADLAMAPELRAESQQDLFVYTVDSLSLKKGGRASVSLWSSQVPKRDLFTLDIRGGRNTPVRVASASGLHAGSPLELERNEVWHQLELSDTTKVPWTTGAALVLDGQLPLAQELLTYTPVGGKTLLPITVAIDVRGSYSESETNRTPNALKWDHHTYARLDKKGAVTVTNYRSEKSTVFIRVTAPGSAKKPSDGGSVQVTGSNHVNTSSTITWEITVKPGESKTVTYNYSMYAR